MVWKNLSIQELTRGAVSTFQRFPLTILSALFGTVICLRMLELSFESREQSQMLGKLVVFSWLGLILFFDLELIAERYGFEPKKRWLVFAAGLAALVAYYFYLPHRLDDGYIVRHLQQVFLFGLGLHLLASFAPYMNMQTEHGFWQFNEKLFLRFLTATLYSGVLYVGLSVAILAIQQLFQVDFDGKIYMRLWLFMAGVFHPWFFLAGVPKDLQALETENRYPKGLKVFTQFVLLPLVTVYLLILYGYLAKILLAWSWPRGWVSYLVLSFSIVGIFSLLLIHPLRNSEGNTWIRTYAKWFYRALFPLLILFALAIWRRVSDYGITEERYFVLVLAFWLLAVALYFLFSRKKNIKFIPVSLCLLAFLVAFGPWGAFAVSQRSQINRLENYFQKNAMFSGEKLRPAPKLLPVEDAREIASIMHYLSDKHGLENIRPWFNPELEKVYSQPYPTTYHDNSRVNDLLQVLEVNRSLSQGQVFETVTPQTEEQKAAKEPIRKDYRFTAPNTTSYKTTGYDYLVTTRFNSGGDSEYFFRLDHQTLSVKNLVSKGHYKQRLGFKWNEKDTSSFDLRPMMRDLIKAREPQPKDEAFTQFTTVGNARLKLYFKTISITELDAQPGTVDFEVTIFVKAPAGSGSESGE